MEASGFRVQVVGFRLQGLASGFRLQGCDYVL
jgi:hypothetical protein